LKRFLEQNFYDLLEISPSATPEEILRAYERARSLYGAGSLAAYAVLTPEEGAVLARRIEEAGDVLIDPEARAGYDARLPAEEVRPARPSPEPPAQTPPLAYLPRLRPRRSRSPSHLRKGPSGPGNSFARLGKPRVSPWPRWQSGSR
jgi:Mce-associated membrane protein